MFGLVRALKVGVVEGVIDLNPGGLSSYLGIVVVHSQLDFKKCFSDSVEGIIQLKALS